jgi:CRISPR/Cas system-associated exonuclease Cas4 (RecB family)
LKFSEKKHEYRVGKVRLRSVTEWVKSFFVPFDGKTISKYVAASRRRKGEKVTATQVRKEWKAKADDGTLVHRDIELYIRGEKTIVDVDNERSLNGINYYDLKLRQRYPNAQFFPEVRIYSEELRLAGTIDLLIITSEGNAVIVDWKTNKEITDRANNKNPHPVTGAYPDSNLLHYTLQLSVYAYILEKEYGMSTERLCLAHLTLDECKEIVVEYKKALVKEMIRHEETITEL